LLHTHAAAARGKVAYTDDQVAEARAVGQLLLATLRPKGARPKNTSAELVAATDLRNRLWTLFELTWEKQVWRSGAWIFGRAADAHAPAPRAPSRGKRNPKPPPAETPPAP